MVLLAVQREDRKFGSIGILIVVTDLRIADLDTGEVEIF
jgi:hypothetical protein